MNELMTMIPPEYAIYGTLAWVVIQSLGRAYAAIAKGGGLKGIYSGLVFGTNTPKTETTDHTDNTDKTRV